MTFSHSFLLALRGAVLTFIIFLASLSVLTAQEYGRVTSALLGRVEQADDCTPEFQAFNDRIMVFGRIAASTRAFEEILSSRIRELYRECNNDPFYGQSIDVQIRKAIDASRSLNGVHIKCTGGSGNASASLGNYDNLSDEFFSWGAWFSSVHSQLSKPVCRAGQSTGDDNCRFAAYPWPYSQAAGIVWHEAMHQKGYTHGANDQEAADDACGYPGDRNWHFQRNTMPYIIGNAITEVINKSAERCDLDACASGNQLQMITSANGTTCNCVNDPGQKGLALMQLKNGKLVDQTIKPHEEWIGGWHLGAGNKIAGQGDFNGDGTDDFIITSGWGIGLFSHNGSYFTSLMTKPNGTRFGGWNFQSRDNQILGTGDFNGDGKDDIVVTSNWGIGILTYRSGTLQALVVKPGGTRFGGWSYNASTDQIQHIGDFTGDGTDDLLITSGWGIGVLKLQGSTLNTAVIKPNGTRFGGWNFNSRDNRLRAVGDFNGDGKQDIALSSGWGIGLLTVSGSTFSALVVKPNDTWFGAWRWGNSNIIRQAGDFNGDGKDELVVTSGWGIGVLRLNGTSLTSVVAKPNGTRFGGWNIDAASNTVGAAVDLNGNGKEELLISSGWGMGVLSLRGDTFTALDLKPFGKLMGSWPLQRTDNFGTAGQFNRNSGRLLFMAGR